MNFGSGRNEQLVADENWLDHDGGEWSRSCATLVVRPLIRVRCTWVPGAWLALTPGARIEARLPDVFIRRVMGILVIAIGARYLWSGLS